MDQFEVVRADTRNPVPRILHEGAVTRGEINTIAALKRRRVLIGFLILAALAATFLVSRLMTPLYEAEAGIMFNPRELSWVGATTQAGALPPSEEMARKNEVAIVRSRALAQSVVDSLQLDRLPEFNPALRPPSTLRKAAQEGVAALDHALKPAMAYLPPGMVPKLPSLIPPALPPDRLRDEIITRFLARVQIGGGDASRMIGIRFLSENPERAALIANRIADRFIAQKRDQDVESAETLAANLKQEIDDLNREIRDSERRLEEQRIALGLDSDSNIKVLADRMAELNRQLIGLTAERLRAESQFAEAGTTRGSTQESGLDSTAQVLNSPLIQRLQEALAYATARVGQLSLRYSDSHPTMIAARSELRDLRARLAAETNKIQNARLNAVAIAKANEDGLRQQVEQLKVQTTKANQSEVELRVMERNVEAKRTLLPQLETRRNNAIAQIDYLRLHGPETQVISPAVVPNAPSHPPTLAMMATAFVVAAGAGILLAVLLERADGTVQSLSQIRRVTPVRIVGTLPVIRGRRWSRRPPAEQVLERDDPLFLEHLRAIAVRTGLAGPAPAKVLLFTSSVSDEGKSSAATSLARMLALSGRRTVLVDADLRAPTVHRVLGLKRGPGLGEYVVEGCGLDAVVQPDTVSGADVITAGQSREAASDILQSPRMQELIDDLTRYYDTVIIDTPPVLAVVDTHILARLADMTLMMVRWRSTPISTFMTALQQLSDDRVPVDGIVLSQVDGRKYKLYGYADSDLFSPGFRKYHSRVASNP
ncbi:GumC family protein [Azospirillum doebereinerae]|uniref:non-specific protein-tyrosine kinase n=1 Tax=Azospirillum doebereinerae TaxID=92933 RepID=A0A3S0V6K4_9PROT|nr:polysaccharide biosynthesis tyrosine autokinase [Azospirillum doebereinerae]RUQ72091.1 polysaccharide biosynthesis tyrosine autokinase [Azospirillum doebereinerae]